MCPKVSAQYKIEVKNKIVESALIAFSKYGYDKTRMDDIAVAAKVSKGTLYLYFKSKEELFYAISETNILRLREQLSSLMATGKEELVSNAEKFYENFHNETGQDFDKVFFEVIAELPRNPKLKRMLYEHRLRIIDIVTEYLSLQVEKDLFAKDIDIKAISAGLVSLFNGLSISKVSGMSESSNKQAWKETIKAIFKGMS
ncbi:MAG TPA: TetR/AcrR family transcriptional regulator [Nitrososphaeraceae archaeon]|nr:TetR/AcrR family transcriptional regulator [Nitrososphaeraceae archaeon]